MLARDIFSCNIFEDNYFFICTGCSQNLKRRGNVGLSSAVISAYRCHELPQLDDASLPTERCVGTSGDAHRNCAMKSFCMSGETCIGLCVDKHVNSVKAKHRLPFS